MAQDKPLYRRWRVSDMLAQTADLNSTWDERHGLRQAQYRTLEYLPDFPHHFNSLESAKQFCTEFFYQYHYIYRHSGSEWHTPASVHYGLAPATARRRSEALAAARVQHPTRFATDPDPKILGLPPAAWINEPKKTEEDTAA